MVMTLLVWAVIALCAAAIVTVYLAIKMRRDRAADRRNERERAMEEDAYRLARARLIYRRKVKEERGNESDPLSAFGVDVPTDMRKD